MNNRKIYLIIVILGLIVSAAVFVQSSRVTLNPQYPFACTSQSVVHVQMAKNLAEGRGFSGSIEAPFLPAITYMPGYPALLAFSLKIFHSYLPVIILQFLTLPLLGILVFRGGLLFTQNKKILSAVAVLSMIEPVMWYDRGCLYGEPWLSLAFILAVFFFLKFLGSRSSLDIALVALFMSVSVYIKAAVLLMPVLPVLFLIYLLLKTKEYGRYLKFVILYVAVVVVILGPWSLRNYYLFRTFRLSNGDSNSIYFDTIPTLLGNAKGKSGGEMREEFYKGTPISPGYGGIDHAEADRYLGKKTLEVFKKYPLQTLRTFATGTFNFFTKTEWPTILERWQIVHPAYQPKRSLLGPGFGDGTSSFFSEIVKRFSCGWSCIVIHGITILGRMVWLFITLFSFLGLVALFKKGYCLHSVFLSLTIFYFGFSYGFLSPTGVERYRLLIIPILLFLAVFGLNYLLKFFNRLYGRNGES